METTDLLVVGGGPAGLAVAIEGARHGLGSVVLEQQPGPPDKACGEGLNPRGVRALERLGVLEHLEAEERAPFVGIRFVTEEHAVEGRFWTGEGLGIRRTALVRAMSARARELGVSIRYGEPVRKVRMEADRAWVETGEALLSARLLIAADGLHSPLRRQGGFRWHPGPPRFGMRRHFAVAPWSPYVEVHLGPSAEAYVTPVGPAEIGLAFLWSRPRRDADGGTQRPGWDELLAQFPALGERLAGAAPRSQVRGAGPLGGRADHVARGRMALVGDAAASVDPISGEGLGLAFACARALARAAQAAVRADRFGWARYEAAHTLHYTRARAFAAALLAIAERSSTRTRLVRLLAAEPRAFRALLAAAG